MTNKDIVRLTVFIIMFILLIQCISAIDAGTDYTLTTINCYGNVVIDVRGETPINRSEYSFKGCSELKKNYWSCNCINGNNLPIILLTKNTTKNIYDIVLEYYISPESDRGTIVRDGVIIHDDSKRTDNFNDIYVGLKPIEIVKEKFKMPELPGGWSFIIMVIVIVAIIIFIIGIGYLFVKFLFTEKDYDKDIAPKKVMQTQKKNDEDISDEELDNLLKDL